MDSLSKPPVVVPVIVLTKHGYRKHYRSVTGNLDSIEMLINLKFIISHDARLFWLCFRFHPYQLLCVALLNSIFTLQLRVWWVWVQQWFNVRFEFDHKAATASDHLLFQSRNCSQSQTEAKWLKPKKAPHAMSEGAYYAIRMNLRFFFTKCYY